MKRSSLLLLSLLLAAGCTRRNKDIETDPTGGATDGAGRVDGADANGGATASDAPQHVVDIVANFKKVHFEFDSAELSPESKDALDANAALLQKHTDVKVQIQGHADERGTTEYNMALGDRRANQVRDYLVNQGISPSRLAVVSYGEEAPLEQGANETAWSMNRRAEFVVTYGDGKVKSSTD